MSKGGQEWEFAVIVLGILPTSTGPSIQCPLKLNFDLSVVNINIVIINVNINININIVIININININTNINIISVTNACNSVPSLV